MPVGVWRIGVLRGSIQFARQCLENSVGGMCEVEQAHVLEILTGESAS